MAPNFYIFFGVLGLIFGSFFNVVIHRLPKILDDKANKKTSKSSVLKHLSYPNSHCPSCKKTIKWYDNIPLLSWLLLRGQCRYCKSKISLIYPVVELITMAFFIFCYMTYGLTLAIVVWIIFFSILILLFFIDMTSFYLPNILTYPLIVSGLFFSLFGFTEINITTSLIGSVLGFLVFLVINKLYKRWRGIDGFGGADKLLLAGLGGWLGYKSLYPIIMFSSFLGLGFMLLMLLIGKNYQMETRLPFGPFLILSSLLVYIHLYVYPITFMRFFYEL